jgi:hypothetical protein
MNQPKIIAISQEDRRLHGCPYCSDAGYQVLSGNSIDSALFCQGCEQTYVVVKDGAEDSVAYFRGRKIKIQPHPNKPKPRKKRATKPRKV